MKLKSLALIILFAVIPFVARSQSADMVKNGIWGIKGNLNAELPGKWKGNGESIKMYNSGFGVSLGGLYNYYLGKNFYFEPELALFYEGYSYDKIIIESPNSPAVNAGPNIYKLGLRLPVVFGYEINISDTWGLKVFTGPQLDYAFYGTVKTDIDEFKQDEYLMSLFGNEYGQRRFGVDWKVGVGFPVNQFLISLEAEFGLNDLLKNDLSFRENRVGLGITYYFVK